MALATLSSGGYSVKPLREKFGYKPGATIAFVALPDELSDLPGTCDFGKVARRQTWARPLGPGTYDAIHAFTCSREELAGGLRKLRKALDDRAAGHTGFTGTSVWLDPAAGFAFVLLTNRVHPVVPAESFQFVRRGFHRLAASVPRAR